MAPSGPLADDAAKLSATKQRLLEKWLAGGGRTAGPTVPRRARPDAAVLSFAQERLWFLAQLHPGNPYHNMVEAIRLRGPLDRDALRGSLEHLIDRHEALRTVFDVRDGEPRQLFPARQPLALTEGAPPAPGEDVAERLRDASQRPFDLTRGPLIRFDLTPLGPDEHVLMVTMHHLVGDGMSMGILFRELYACYEAATAGRPFPQLAELPVTYGDFAEWQRGLLRGAELERRLTHWRDVLREPLPNLDRLADRPRRGATSLQAVSRAFRLSAEVSDGLRTLARDHQATLFMVLLAGFKTLMHRRTGGTDIVTGSVVHGRDLPETENLVGFFANTLALRADLSGDPSFTDVLDRVRRMCLEAYAHRDTPIEVLAAELRPGRNHGDNPLFQAAVVEENVAGEARMGDLEVGAFDFGLDTSEFDLVLHYWETDGRVEGGVRASADLFDPASVDRFTAELEALFAAVLADPRRPVSALPLPAAPAAPARHEPETVAVPEAAPDEPSDVALTPTEREVAAVWREVLGLREIDPDEDFFEAGGHSLRAVRVLLRLRERLGVDLPVQVFFEARTVTALAAVFDRARGAAREPAEDSHDTAALTADAVLDPDVTCADSAPHDPGRTTRPEHVLLTGATSFLGAHLLARLLDRTTARVHCLVEADDPAEAADALERALARYGVTVPWERVAPLPGSLREPRLGLSPIAFARLAATVDVIHHAGCDANLALPYGELRAANVGGTTEVLRLAARDRVKAVHYVSSPGVLFDRDAEPGTLAPDGRVPADRVLPSGYVRTRWAAEELVDAARERGVPVSVYRPGRLGGDSATGVGDPDSAFGRFLGACVRLGAVPAYGPDADFDLVPVDHAAAALVELALKPETLGGTYHLAHPVRTRFADVVERLRAAGHPLTETDPEEWSRAVAADVLEPGTDGDESVASVAALAGASRGMPGFGSLRLDVTGTLRALAGAVPCPPVDGPLLDRYLDHLAAAGPLPSPAGSRTPGSEIVI
ncbi:thioester reductase domain-containing protein [Streptomyces mobaraensis]|uniref:NAD-dependent epimerase/dehydratase family protein n=1 Tax=Streptomyces mobaraensis TaxID=35621 RepID=A0A5N5W4B4_STRMB|nr:thioester reductase domain-containing protein [Streptomyces mobaraensis]KAB7836967.1 NAD-dependent epimerase/dehydratase family protein [Streptomyces mobaraensis]